MRCTKKISPAAPDLRNPAAVGPRKTSGVTSFVAAGVGGVGVGGVVSRRSRAMARPALAQLDEISTPEMVWRLRPPTMQGLSPKWAAMNEESSGCLMRRRSKNAPPVRRPETSCALLKHAPVSSSARATAKQRCDARSGKRVRGRRIQFDVLREQIESGEDIAPLVRWRGPRVSRNSPQSGQPRSNRGGGESSCASICNTQMAPSPRKRQRADATGQSAVREQGSRRRPSSS